MKVLFLCSGLRRLVKNFPRLQNRKQQSFHRWLSVEASPLHSSRYSECGLHLWRLGFNFFPAAGTCAFVFYASTGALLEH
jgi:hypothetical protein